MSDHERFTVDAARAAAERGELGAWVSRFLASPGSDNAELAAILEDRLDCWTGPLLLQRSKLNRLAGPPDEPALCPVEDDFWDERVDDMAERIDAEDWEPSPVIVSCANGDLVLEDGNHRLESLRRAGRDEVWAVVGFERPEDRDAFEAAASAVVDQS